MTDDIIRLYEQGRFSCIAAPDWFERAIDISSREQLAWHRAVSRALEAEHLGLTSDALGPFGLEISYWSSPCVGIYVEIDSYLAPIEQVLIRDPADWLPFLSAHLTPLLAATAQMETSCQLERLTNAVISRARYGEGTHLDRETGLSRIDLDNDRKWRLAERNRTVRDPAEIGGGA